MTTALLFIVGAVLAFGIALRKVRYSEEYAWWPTWWEWSVQTFGVALISAAILRVFVSVLVEGV